MITAAENGRSTQRLEGDTTPPPQPIVSDKRTPGNQTRPLTQEEEIDVALDDTFPASDPVGPHQVDGPND